MKILQQSLGEIHKTAQSIIEFGSEIPIWLFDGSMGAGKTTLIKSLCSQLEIIDTVNSPTFSIVNEYHDVLGNSYYHFDLYRLEDEEELLDIGFEEYLSSGNRCFIEWPDIAMNHLPQTYMSIKIDVSEENFREIHLTKYGSEETIRI